MRIRRSIQCPEKEALWETKHNMWKSNFLNMTSIDRMLKRKWKVILNRNW